MADQSGDTPTAHAAADELDAREPPHLVAWGLVVLGALLVVFTPVLGVIATAIAAAVAHQTKAPTARIAAVALLVVGLILLLFNGVSGVLGGGLYNA